MVINFWTLYVICLITGIALIVWNLRLKKKMKDNGFTVIGFALSLSSTSTMGITLLLGRFVRNFFTDPTTPSHVFLMWIIYLILACICLVIARRIFRKRLEDQPNKASLSLKQLQNKQAQEVKELMAK